MPKYSINESTLSKFPQRQQDVLKLMSEGIHSPSVIAAQLGIEVSSVQNIMNGTKKNGTPTEIGIKGMLKELTGVETNHEGFVMTLVRKGLAKRRE